MCEKFEGDSFGGVVYRVDDLTSGVYYIGLCRSKKSWNSGYLGSGVKGSNHLSKYKDHYYKRVVIQSGFDNEVDLFYAEQFGIKKFISDPKCYNIKTTLQGKYVYSTPKNSCEFCGTPPGGFHNKNCPNYEEVICGECGGKSGNHLKTCSKYDFDRGKCNCCGLKGGSHEEGCDLYTKNVVVCNICNGKKGNHFKGCPESNKMKESPSNVCAKCGWGSGIHSMDCELDIKRDCCGTSEYWEDHLSDCEGNPENIYDENNKCRVCGYDKQSNKHSKDCKFFVNLKTCSECNGRGGKHKKECSYYINPENSCEFCGTPPGGFHKKSCPNGVDPGVCEYCGYSKQSHKHARNCPNFK